MCNTVRWIRPATTVDTLIPKTDRVVRTNGIRYVVKRTRVPTMDYNPAIEVRGVVEQETTEGPFQIGPMCVGRVYEEAGGFIDADWYFEMF